VFTFLLGIGTAVQLPTWQASRACQLVCGAPRGAVVSSGGERTPPLACRGRSVKLAAA
jgi:hypothetical protein